jgi:hypothetical protein
MLNQIAVICLDSVVANLLWKASVLRFWENSRLIPTDTCDERCN